MADLNTIRKRLEQHIIASGHTFREVSLKIGRKDSYIQQYVKYGFPKRLNEVDRKKVCQLLNIDEAEMIDEELLQSGIPENPILRLQEMKGDPSDFVAIDIYNPRPGLPLARSIIGRMAINYKEFFGWCNGNPYNLKMLRLNGDSMEPAIAAGSLIIFDSSVLEYAGDGLYIVRYDGQITLRRLQKNTDGGYLLKTENTRYQDIVCAENEVEILGRAINYLISRPL